LQEEYSERPWRIEVGDISGCSGVAIGDGASVTQVVYGGGYRSNPKVITVLGS